MAANRILIGGFTRRQAGPQLRVARRVAPLCLYAPFFSPPRMQSKHLFALLYNYLGPVVLPSSH